MTDIRRKAPSTSYAANGRVLAMHPSTLDALAAVAATCSGRRVEWCALLYGDRGDVCDVVRTIVAPKQDSHCGYYTVTGTAMQAASAAVGTQVLVGQVHAHPGRDVEHSTVDDDKVASSRIVSIVVPNYGSLLPARTGWGVHDRQDRYWHLLAPTVAARRVVVSTDAPGVDLKDLR